MDKQTTWLDLLVGDAKQAERDTRSTVMKLAADYRKLGLDQSAALRLAWQQVKAAQDEAATSAGQLLQVMQGQLGGLGQVLAGFAEGLRKIGEGVNWLLFGDGADSADALAQSSRAAAKGQQTLTKSTKAAAKAVARTVLGIDELNLVQQQASIGGGSSSGSSTGGTAGEEVDEARKKWIGLVNLLRPVLDEVNRLFAPSIAAWGKAFGQLARAAQSAWALIRDSALELWDTALRPLGEYLLGEFIPNIVNAFSETFAPIVGAVGELFLEQFARNFSLGCQLVGDAIQNYLMPLLGFLQQVVQDMLAAVSEAWAVYGQPILDRLAEGFEQLRNWVQTLYYELIRPVLDELMARLQELWEEHLAPLWENLTLLFGAVMELIAILWTDALLPLLQNITDTFAPLVAGAVQYVVDCFFNGLGTIAKVADGIAGVLRGLCEFVSGVFTGDWDRAWHGLSDIFESVWDTMVGVAKQGVNGIIDLVNAMLRALTGGMNAVIDRLNGIGVEIPSWVPDYGGQRFGVNLPRVPEYQIPRLAKGAVLPANRPFLAVVGDQRRGTNVEAPLETIRQAVADVLGGAGAAQLYVSQPIEVKLDGQVLYRAMAKIEANRGARIGGAFAEAY
ncbi:phage tail protein [Allofournierella massiliensis]|uniref:Phage-related protein n=1 Tax=Allofournierella massiliensis TaxID=1650663 RepID=A0ABT7UPI1_9FIRM|nr:hypothetical protein [Fournierella massiliensis]MDM8200805.1 hypothetical protein [Fournierella massiliensis]